MRGGRRCEKEVALFCSGVQQFSFVVIDAPVLVRFLCRYGGVSPASLNLVKTKSYYPRWIDTSAMVSDCLTKTMISSRLNETLSTGVFDLRPTEESLAIKAKNRKWKASKKEQERLQGPDN